MSAPVLIFGAGGQVGQALLAHAAAAGFEAKGFSSREADVTDLNCLRGIAKSYPDAAVINAGAYTAVDKAEEDRERAFAVNATGPAFLAAAFGDRPIIHYSTDYVFPGDGKTPYQEDDETRPLGVYGLSKRVGEMALLNAPRASVIRTAWVYSETGHNFLKTMVRVGRERGALRVVDDQRGTPTHASDIAAASFSLLDAMSRDPGAAGMYHYTASGETTWFGFAKAIFAALAEQTGTDVTVEPINSAEYPTPAARPAYSVLDGHKIESVLGLKRPAWESRVAATVAAVL